ncbi:hypothetical protein FJZ17_02800 [Candidatus Pacearchaeota archaeon]|nr:hypothetical protein [Candidatus Pacearchaeota archaeon]
MGLEKLFAEVQVLVANIVGRRQLSSQELPGNPPIDFYGEGIVRESENMARAYRGVLHTLQYSKRKIPNQKVARRVREQSRTASSYMGEFALCTKNFADNLNRFLQSLYGARKMDIDLRDLKERVQDAPRTTDNREIYEVFSQVHDPRGDLTHLRNARGHGNGHLIVSWDDYFLIPIKDGSVEAKVWLDQQAQAYLGMAKTILETIYEKEQKVLSSRKDSKPHSLTMQRIKNFTKAHSNTGVELC